MKKRILGVLGKRLLLYFVTLSLIPALVLSYINYIHSKKLLETELFNELSLVGQGWQNTSTNFYETVKTPQNIFPPMDS